MDIPTLISTPSPKVREGAWLWLFKIAAGLVIILLLGVHFVVNHLVAPGGLLTYADVVSYYANPIIAVMEGLFLAFVLGHALVGIRGIILDLNPSDQALRLVDWVLVVVGAAALVYGIWLLAVISARS